MSETLSGTGTKPRLRGRDPRETPKVRPIADSNVELYVPASSKPVQVHHAHARRLFYYFALPLSVFALMAVIGVWLFMIVSREHRMMTSRPKAKVTADSPDLPLMNGAEFLASAPREVPPEQRPTLGSLYTHSARAASASAALPPLVPVRSLSEAQEACDLVRRLLEEDTLEKKLALTSDPEQVKSEFVRRFEARDARVIQPRTLRCVNQFERDDRVYLVVNATLFDFSKRDYIVQRGDRHNRVVIQDPASLLP